MPTESGFWGRGRGRVGGLVQGSRDLMGGIRPAQVVDGSTRLQLGREGLIPTAMGEQLVHGGEMSVENPPAPACQGHPAVEVGSGLLSGVCGLVCSLLVA